MTRLIVLTAIVSAIALTVTVLALWGIEGAPRPRPSGARAPSSFMTTLRAVWADDQARRFTVFVFVSMLAYSAQDLILEPFAGIVFGMTPGQSTQLAGLQNGGVLLGMVLVGFLGTWRGRSSPAALRSWCIAGCIASAVALIALTTGGLSPGSWPLRANVFALGLANGVFAVAAIGSMMALAGAGRGGREGVRMGLWGAAQAIAFAAGGVLGTAAVDVARHFTTDAAFAYGLVFAVEAAVFLWAAVIAVGLGREARAAGARAAATVGSSFSVRARAG
jgi:BCD family chlorophyll transporter-like MFS transporter